MLRFKVNSRKANIGKRKGQTLYYAQQEMAGRMTLGAVENEIVQRTSLAKGDVRNAIASLAEVVNNALLNGLMVDLGDLGSFKIVANGKQMSSEAEVDATTVKKPRIMHYPKAEMKQHAERVAISVRRDKEGSSTSGSGSSTGGVGLGTGGGGTSGSGSVGTGGGSSTGSSGVGSGTTL